MEVIQFTDGSTRHEVWELPDRGWDDWAAVADKFLAHCIKGLATECTGEVVKWLEINHWPYSGRLIVFPSQDGPHGDREERVCYELASEHLLCIFRQVSGAVPESDREWAWINLSRRVWARVSECLLFGIAGQELTDARRLHRLQVAGYDYQPGEGLLWLTEDGSLRPDSLN